MVLEYTLHCNPHIHDKLCVNIVRIDVEEEDAS